MKLQALRLHGFKSFADRTELRFHDGLTAIVGPNGCGKSNISDAVRWVLGEQKASAIRSSRMDDAIFQGTTDRRRVNRAEVELIVSNEEGSFGVPYDPVEIRRTVFRDGGSEYAVNRNTCRLKDIHDMCRDTGLGTNAYAIIEQGMVDSILSERAEDRRHMFEEAAGIGRYKDRRKTAQRRLEQSETDLSRLQDLISEVETKVRSLARQKGKAQKHRELRERRLALELILADAELDAVREELKVIDGRLEAMEREQPAVRALLATAEAELEQRRLASAEETRERNELAAQAEELGRRIAELERSAAVADERRTNALSRLEQIALERERQQARMEAIRGETVELDAREREIGGRLAALVGEGDRLAEQVAALRARLDEARQGEAASTAESDQVAAEVHRLEGLAASAEARAADAATRLDRLVAERETLTVERTGLEEQGDLFADHRRELERSLTAAWEDRERQVASVAALREALADARRRLVESEDRATRLASELSATETILREFRGYSPAVASAMTASGLRGLRGPLADLLSLDDARAAAVEASLGSLLQTLVVADSNAADAVAAWLASADEVEGVLALLPASEVPRARELLASLRFAGSPASAPSLVGRRERLERLRAEALDAAAKRAERATERDALAERLSTAEESLRQAEAALNELELELRRATADESVRHDRRERLTRLTQQLDEEEAFLERTVQESQEAARAAREGAGTHRGALDAARERRREVGERVEAAQHDWDAARERLAEHRVEQTRLEAERDAIVRRRGAAGEAAADAGDRLRTLDAEEATLRASLDALAAEKGDSDQRLEELFRARDALIERLRAFDERSAEAAERAEELERMVRRTRAELDRTGEEKHRLELRRSDISGAERRVRERLEAEWSRPVEQLRREAIEITDLPPEFDIESMRAELTEITASIERLGPVNMLAVEEHAEESRRLEFLTAQRDDLQAARDNLQAAIRKINRAARELFIDTFEKIRANFQNTFQTLFEGGECDLWLADPEDPLESPIEISASPRGKRTQRIHLLSGGERALTALALLFAIYLVKPSPFCVLDEVDAPLDEANIGRFLLMLNEFKTSTQFVVITHNPRTMEAADWIYGVTMEEPGVSSIVAVELEEAAQPTAV
ncbi:MAG TPA: AAA family ATPase, partial [Longimicrobiales bacterium]|nr:AAA family ATPase [Longimicrobiales bacterium]